jgi:hypothetical protein
MEFISKIVGFMSCGFLLCLSLYTATQSDYAASAADELKADHSDRSEGGQPRGGKTITGEVLRVEGNDCFVKGQDGKEVRLHIDLVTVMARNIEPGQSIEAKVDDQNHVIAILSAPAVTDRRNDKE